MLLNLFYVIVFINVIFVKKFSPEKIRSALAVHVGVPVSKIESFYHSFGAIALEKQISIHHVISIYFQSLEKNCTLF